MLTRAVVVLAALAVCMPAAAVGPKDRLLVLDQRAGPYRYLASLDGRLRDYEAAVRAFGEPTRVRGAGNLCRVTWRSAGISVGFASTLGACSKPNLRRGGWYGMSLFGAGWHTTRGLRVGDPVAKVRRIYPNARIDSASGWLVLARKRDQELDFVRLAVTLDANGRVASIEVAPTYVY